MKVRYSWIVLMLLLTACDISVTSFPSAPGQPLAPTEMSPAPYPDTPTPVPATINAPPVGSPALISVHFFDEIEGWGVTDSQIVRTNDGGVTWYSVTPTDVTDTASVGTFFLDKTHAWIQKPDFNNYPNNGLLYRTTDGGLTWTIASTPFSGGDLSFLDANKGWMLADLGVGAGSNAVAVFQTVDGGATWIQTYTNDPNNPDAGDSLPLGGLKSDLLPLNMQTAWIGGVIYTPGTPYLYRTDDGGRIWSQVNLELPAEAQNAELDIYKEEMQLVSAKDGFLVIRLASEATQTAVYTTRDAGNTWSLTPTLIANAGTANFLSAQEAILYNGEQFYVTRDSARTWTVVSPKTSFGDSFAFMDFVDLNVGWIITADANKHRSLYRTNDGGATWLPVIP